jgi:biotin carboxyl carrier protein
LATKLKVTLGSGRAASEHQIEIETAEAGADRGETQCRLDSGPPLQANWTRVAPGLYSILLGGRSYEARVTPGPGGSGSRDYSVRVGTNRYRVELHDPRSWQRGRVPAGSEGPQDVRAPMPGKIVKLLVREGDEVQEDQGLLVMEAMKMQNELRSPRTGRVERIYVAEGAGAETGAPLVRLASL